MSKPLRTMLSSEKGEGTLTFPILVLIICMTLFIGVDILGAYSAHQKLRSAASEALTHMKAQNGWDANTRDRFEEMLTKTGLSPAEVAVNEATDRNQVPAPNRGDMLTLDVSTTYEVRSLKPINRTLIIPIKVRLSGLAQDYRR